VDKPVNIPDIVNYHRKGKSQTETMQKRPQIKIIRTSLETDTYPALEEVKFGQQ
jgi:hypothetical protein